MQTSARRGIAYPDLVRDDAPDIPLHIANLVAALDLDVIWTSGIAASRPGASLAGKVYWATDTLVLSLDIGSSWVTLYPQAGTPDNSITGGPAGTGVKIEQNTITHDNIVAGTIRGGGNEIAAASITAADISATLKPSGGAGGSTEALRALGTAAGTAAAGAHAAQHALTGADPLVASINTVTASYTLVIGDAGNIVETNVASGNVVTIPPQSSVAWPNYCSLLVVQFGVGQTTIAGGAGVTVHAIPGLKLVGQYAFCTLLRRSTDVWYAGGNLSA